VIARARTTSDRTQSFAWSPVRALGGHKAARLCYKGAVQAAAARVMSSPETASTERKPERRLAAVLASDVVGYSRLMEADEEGTLARLRRLREDIIDPAVARHRGRVFKAMGDGLLIEFPSIVEAIACAVAIQQELAESEANAPPERRLRLRIGVNIGDMIGEGEDVFGDAVNVAARLEGIAEPGGILASAAAFEQVRDRRFAFEDLGEKKVKNLTRPIRVYRVRAAGMEAEAGPPIAASARRRRVAAIAAASAALALALAAGAWWRWPTPVPPTAPSRPPAAAAATPPAAPGPPLSPETAEDLRRGEAALARRELVAARAFFEQVLARDPQALDAQLGLAQVAIERVIEGESEDRAADLEQADRLVGEVLAARPNNAVAHLVKGHVLRARRRLDAARQEYEAAIALNGHYAVAYANLARTKLLLGQPAEAVPLLDRAMQLNPRDALMGLAYNLRGAAELFQGHGEEAVAWLEKARATNAKGVNYLDLAAAYGLAGQAGAAQDALAMAQQRDPKLLSIRYLQGRRPSDEPAYLDLREKFLFEGLRKAGLPER